MYLIFNNNLKHILQYNSDSGSRLPKASDGRIRIRPSLALGCF